MGTAQADAIAELERLHRQYQAFLDALTDADWERPGTIGGGDWSLRDLVGHIASWESLALGTVAEVTEQRPQDWPAGDIDQVNHEMVLRQRRLPLDELRRTAAETHGRLMSTIAGLTPTLWSSAVAIGPGSNVELGEALGRVLGSDEHPFGHLRDHLGDLRSFALASDSDRASTP